MELRKRRCGKRTTALQPLLGCLDGWDNKQTFQAALMDETILILCSISLTD
jgi:hypothetical protein